LSSEIVEATAKKLARRVWSFVSEDGCMLRRRGKVDGQRAGKMKKRIKTRCRVNPDNPKEKCPLDLR
jgi:hypothetical protein